MANATPASGNKGNENKVDPASNPVKLGSTPAKKESKSANGAKRQDF